MAIARTGKWDSLKAALGVYLLGTAIVLGGILFGIERLTPSTGPHSRPRAATAGIPLVDTLALWDGQWYQEIAISGYNYDPRRASNVAFFPGYPLAVRAVSAATRLPTIWAALAVSHAFLLGTYLLLYRYVRQRFPDGSARLANYVLLALALFPATFFMRMVYSEAMFVFLTVLAMYGMARRWPLWAIVPAIAAATAARFAGVALLLPLAAHVCSTAGSAKRAAATLALAAPLALGGLLCYMLYQKLAFNEPAAFIKTQDFWRFHVPENLSDKLLGLASWEPVWSAYIPSWPGYARRLPDPAPAAVSLQFANPVFFAGALAMVVMGAWKGWLSRSEMLLAAGLILVSYAAKGFEMCMASQGRFVAAAFPIYIVMGQILARLPRPCSIAILVVFGAYLAIYSAMLAAGYVLI